VLLLCDGVAEDADYLLLLRRRISPAFGTGTNPIGLAVDAAGNVWTANDNSTEAIEEHNETGELLQSFGSKGEGNGQVSEPKRLAVDANGYVWVPDAGNDRVEVFSSNGEYVTQFGVFGAGAEQMNHPVGVAVDPPVGQINSGKMHHSAYLH
jgi:DNA-binding beta-propeller fold protein YncE